MPGGGEFTRKFNARFGKIQIYAPFAYDAATVLVTAMKKADSAEPAKYLPELAKVSIDGVIGPISFDQYGDLKQGAVTLYQVTGGQWVPLETMGGQ